MASDLATLADALAKFPKLLEMLYVDLAQPGVKQVGTALETIVGLGNTAMWPIALLNSRSKAALVANMERYRRKMEAIPPEQVINVAPEIGVPIAEKLTYVSDDQLAGFIHNCWPPHQIKPGSEMPIQVSSMSSTTCARTKPHYFRFCE